MASVHANLAELDSSGLIVLALKTLTFSPETALATLRHDEQLRGGFLSMIGGLISELETPVETSQRLLYNVSRIIIEVQFCEVWLHVHCGECFLRRL